MKHSAYQSMRAQSQSGQTLLLTSAPAEARNVALVRSSLKRTLAGVEMDRSDADDIVLAVGEACNNVVLHSSGIAGQKLSISCVQVLSPAPAIVVEISSLGTKLVDKLTDSLFAMPSAELMGEHGRGLPLIRSLVDSVDVFAKGDSTVMRLTKRI